MDPLAAWKELLDALSEMDWDRVLETAENLLEWITNGGFPPEVIALTGDGQSYLGRVVYGPELNRTVVDAARLTESRRSTGATHLDRLRGWIEETDAIEHELPIVTVPELFARASGPRVVSLVADALTDELDPDPMTGTQRGTS